MKDDREITPADMQAILDAAQYQADLFDALEEAYNRYDMKEILTLLRELLDLEKESSIVKESIQ